MQTSSAAFVSVSDSLLPDFLCLSCTVVGLQCVTPSCQTNASVIHLVKVCYVACSMVHKRQDISVFFLRPVEWTHNVQCHSLPWLTDGFYQHHWLFLDGFPVELEALNTFLAMICNVSSHARPVKVVLHQLLGLLDTIMTGIVMFSSQHLLLHGWFHRSCYC